MKNKILWLGVMAILLIGGGLWYGFALPFNQIRCGDSTYVLYQDVENPYYMYNINNSKMFWKFTSLYKSIHYYEVQEGIKTMVHIRKDGKKWSPDFSTTVESDEYKRWIENNISFIPAEPELDPRDLANLNTCYPNALIELETEIKKDGERIEGKFRTL